MQNKRPDLVRRFFGIVPPGTLAEDGDQELKRLSKTLKGIRCADPTLAKKNVAFIQGMIRPVLIASMRSESTNMTPSAPKLLGIMWFGLALYAIGETLHLITRKVVPQVANALILVGSFLLIAAFIAIVVESAVLRKPNISGTHQLGRVAEKLSRHFMKIELNVWVQQRDSLISYYGAIAGGTIGVIGIAIGAAFSFDDFKDALVKMTSIVILNKPVIDLIIYFFSGVFGIMMASILKGARYTRIARLAATICSH